MERAPEVPCTLFVHKPFGDNPIVVAAPRTHLLIFLAIRHCEKNDSWIECRRLKVCVQDTEFEQSRRREHHRKHLKRFAVLQDSGEDGTATFGETRVFREREVREPEY